MDKILDNIEPSKFKAYQYFLRALILEGISGHYLPFDRLNNHFYTLNKEIYEDVKPSLDTLKCMHQQITSPLGI